MATSTQELTVTFNLTLSRAEAYYLRCLTQNYSNGVGEEPEEETTMRKSIFDAVSITDVEIARILGE